MTQEERRLITEMLDEKEKRIKTAETRAAFQKRKAIAGACDCLTILQIGLQKNLADRKTSLTEMANYASFVNDIIETLKAADMWSDAIR